VSKKDIDLIKDFISELPPLVETESFFDVNWSLSELESIVYEFINSPMELPKEFM